MPWIRKLLFPVDFSPSCVAMAPYVKRSAALFGAKVTLIHVVDPASFNSFALVTRPMSEISEDLLEIGRERLDSFLVNEFPAGETSRILAAGDAATEIASVARDEAIDMIIMPTHAGRFQADASRLDHCQGTERRRLPRIDKHACRDHRSKTHGAPGMAVRNRAGTRFGEDASLRDTRSGRGARQVYDHSRRADGRSG